MEIYTTQNRGLVFESRHNRENKKNTTVGI